MNKNIIRIGLFLLALGCLSNIALAEDKPKDPKPAETPDSTVPSDCHGA